MNYVLDLLNETSLLENKSSSILIKSYLDVKIEDSAFYEDVKQYRRIIDKFISQLTGLKFSLLLDY